MTSAGPHFQKLAPRYFTLVAVALAGLHCVLAVSASLEKSPAFDEPAHLTAGYSYWLRGDFRLNPENENLPQRWSALPLLLTHPRFLADEDTGWKLASEWLTGQRFFYQLGNDSDLLLLQGRAFISIFGGALCLLIFPTSTGLQGGRNPVTATWLIVRSIGARIYQPCASGCELTSFTEKQPI